MELEVRHLVTYDMCGKFDRSPRLFIWTILSSCNVILKHCKRIILKSIHLWFLQAVRVEEAETFSACLEW